MRTAAIAIVFVVGATACNDEPAPARRPSLPPAPPAIASHLDCVAASKGALGSPGGTGLGPDVDADLRAKREPIIVKLCDDDDWPLEAARCYAAAEGLMDMSPCWMSPPASTHLTDALQGLMRRELHLP